MNRTRRLYEKFLAISASISDDEQEDVSRLKSSQLKENTWFVNKSRDEGKERGKSSSRSERRENGTRSSSTDNEKIHLDQRSASSSPLGTRDDDRRKRKRPLSPPPPPRSATFRSKTWDVCSRSDRSTSPTYRSSRTSSDSRSTASRRESSVDDHRSRRSTYEESDTDSYRSHRRRDSSVERRGDFKTASRKTTRESTRSRSYDYTDDSSRSRSFSERSKKDSSRSERSSRERRSYDSYNEYERSKSDRYSSYDDYSSRSHKRGESSERSSSNYDEYRSLTRSVQSLDKKYPINNTSESYRAEYSEREQIDRQLYDKYKDPREDKYEYPREEDNTSKSSIQYESDLVLSLNGSNGLHENGISVVGDRNSTRKTSTALVEKCYGFDTVWKDPMLAKFYGSSQTTDEIIHEAVLSARRNLRKFPPKSCLKDGRAGRYLTVRFSSKVETSDDIGSRIKSPNSEVIAGLTKKIEIPIPRPLTVKKDDLPCWDFELRKSGRKLFICSAKLVYSELRIHLPRVLDVTQLPRLVSDCKKLIGDYGTRCPKYEIYSDDSKRYVNFMEYLLDHSSNEPRAGLCVNVDKKGLQALLLPPGTLAKTLDYHGNNMVAVLMPTKKHYSSMSWKNG